MSSSVLPLSAPEAQGLPSEAVLEFVDAVHVRGLELHSLMIVRNGHLVVEGWWQPYAREIPHSLYSLTKSFTSTAAGFAISEGNFTLDDTLVSFFPDKLPDIVSENLASIRVRHLLTMSSGLEADPMGPGNLTGVADWVRQILAQNATYTPGEKFQYSSSSTHLVSAIVQKTTGQRVQDYLQPRLFAKLGIADVVWQNCPAGASVGGWGLSLRTEDIAKLGLLYLQDGIWNDERILPDGWVKLATSKQVSNGDDPESDWSQGYGFQFWRCRHDVYRGDGAFGQYCIVMPGSNAVVAITSAVADMQAVLNEVWRCLLPAMGSEPVAPNPRSHSHLVARLEGASIAFPAAVASASDRDQELATYRIEPIENGPEWLGFSSSQGVSRIRFSTGESLSIDAHRWSDTGASSFGGVDGPLLGRGGWIDDTTYRARLCAIRTPFCFDLAFGFSEAGAVEVEIRRNVGFGSADPLVLHGRRED